MSGAAARTGVLMKNNNNKCIVSKVFRGRGNGEGGYGKKREDCK